MGKPKILVVEDDEVVLKVVQSKLLSAGYDVFVANTSTEAIRATQSVPPDLMLLDLSLPDQDLFNSIRDGLGVLGWVRRLFADEASFPIILHTADDSPATLAIARQQQVHAVFRKGGDLNELLRLISQALDGARSRAA